MRHNGKGIVESPKTKMFMADRQFFCVILDAKIICYFPAKIDEIGSHQEAFTEVYQEALALRNHLRDMAPGHSYEICELQFKAIFDKMRYAPERLIRGEDLEDKNARS